MGRPPEFDRGKALKRALALFWRKGYQATSLSDLPGVMDIGRSSFHAAFTDKPTLHVECMDLFAARMMELLERARDERPPVDVLQDFPERNFVGARGARPDWGCMLVNPVLEMAGVDEDLVARASGHLMVLQRFFRTCLHDAGATPAQAEELAAMLMLFNEGIRVSSRRRLPDSQHLPTVDATCRLRIGISNALTRPGRGSMRHGQWAARREGAHSDASGCERCRAASSRGSGSWPRPRARA